MTHLWIQPFVEVVNDIPVIVERVDDPTRALRCARSYMRRLGALGLETKFIRALWFERHDTHPGVIFKKGQFISPRALMPYETTPEEDLGRVFPWHFAREF